MIRNYAATTVVDLQTKGLTYVHVARMMDRGPDDKSPGWQTIRTAHIMPPDTLALRAGEYGLDPADTALLLDVVLHEPFLEYAEDDHPLWTAPSIAAARERHLDEVATVRAAHAALGKDWDRAKDYPSPAAHRAALIRAAELSPVHRDKVLSGRRMAREAWAVRAATTTRSPA